MSAGLLREGKRYWGFLCRLPDPHPFNAHRIYSRKSGISISQSPEWIAHHYQQLLPGLTFLDLVLLTMVHAHPSAPDNLIHRNVRRHPFIAAAIQRL
jgi:hypothetical protein